MPELMQRLEQAADAFGEAATQRFAADRAARGQAAHNGEWAGKK
jgi:hypothetical protein